MSCSEWQKVRLGDVIEFNPRETIKKKQLAKKVPMDKLDTFTRRINGYEEAEFTSGTKFRNGDTLLARITPCLENGKTAQVDILDDGEVAFGSTEFIVLREKNGKTINDYIYYLSISPEFRSIAIKCMTGSSGRQRVQKDVLEDTEILLPPIEEQEKIANILSSLDDKIKLNNEMNKMLEEMAQSIFKRWFVDFEFPNADCKPYKSSGGEMVESELGMIPKGWEIKTIGDIGNIITGKTPSSKIEGSFGNECKFITPRDISDSVFILKTERELSAIGVEKLKRNIVPKNSIGVSCIGSNLGEVYITGEDSITNQQINTVVLNEDTLFPYVYIYLKNMKEDFLNMSSGSAVPIINKTSFSKVNILIPNNNLLQKYVEATTCYFDRIKENLKEIESLMMLRETLLPKLMSGEIMVDYIV